MATDARLATGSARARARRLLRARALDALSAVTSTGSLATPRVHFLCLHHVEPGERSGFDDLLSSLALEHELISYSEGVRRVTAGDFPRPAIAISFDDGFESCMVAADILERFGARACFFVCPGIVGLEGTAAEAAARSRFDMPGMGFMGWQEIRSLRDRGHEIGIHTFDHARVSDGGVAAFRDDLARCTERFGQLGIDARHFAWPFGQRADFGERYRPVVEAAGLLSCASSMRGAHGDRAGLAAPPYISRENVSASWPVRHVRYFLAASAGRLH